MAEESGMSACDVVPLGVDRSEYLELHLAAHMVSHLDGDGGAFRRDTLGVGCVLLYVELRAQYLVAQLRVNADGKALLVVLIIALALAPLLVGHPYVVLALALASTRHARAQVLALLFLHHALVADDEHACHETQFLDGVGLCAHGTVLIFVALLTGVGVWIEEVVIVQGVGLVVGRRLVIPFRRLPVLACIEDLLSVSLSHSLWRNAYVFVITQVRRPFQFLDIAARVWHYGAERHLSADDDVVDGCAIGWAKGASTLVAHVLSHGAIRQEGCVGGSCSILSHRGDHQVVVHADRCHYLCVVVLFLDLTKGAHASTDTSSQSLVENVFLLGSIGWILGVDVGGVVAISVKFPVLHRLWPAEPVHHGGFLSRRLVIQEEVNISHGGPGASLGLHDVFRHVFLVVSCHDERVAVEGAFYHVIHFCHVVGEQYLVVCLRDAQLRVAVRHKRVGDGVDGSFIATSFGRSSRYFV